MSDKGTLDDQYFEWLYHFIGAVSNRNPTRSYWNMAKQFYTTPFTPFVSNDENRAEDGKDLRYEFLEDAGLDIHEVDPMWMDLDCSMLEMFIALSRRTAFESYGSSGDWFWQFIQNVGLARYTDAVYTLGVAEEVREALERVNQRTYGWDGTGGLFPLRTASNDQRTVEIWYQMAAYLLEGEYVNNGPRV